MPSLIASGTSAADSADFALTDGQTSIVSLAPTGTGAVAVPASAAADVQIKTAAGGYVNVGLLTPAASALIVSGPGTFRVSRRAVADAVGVDRS